VAPVEPAGLLDIKAATYSALRWDAADPSAANGGAGITAGITAEITLDL